jgi:hypothetical protein
MKLLYRTAEWHALAKLRMHSDSTLLLLEELTKEFGQLIRQFRDLTCSQFKTVELSRETAARKRRGAKQQPAASSAVPGPHSSSRLAHASNPNVGMPSSMNSDNVTASASLHSGTGILLPAVTPSTDRSQGQPSGESGSSPRGDKKGLNLFTVKLHFLGDYVRHIRLFGTTDSYSTQLVCECGCQSKTTRTIYSCLTTGRTCPSTCEAALQPHKQKECNPADWEEIHAAASFS